MSGDSRPKTKGAASTSARLGAIKMVALDVDGVLTDGRVWISSTGDDALEFDIKDGMSITLLLDAGIEVALISGRKSGAVIHRAKALGIKKVRVGEKDKLGVLKELIKEAGCSRDEVAFVGDDLADLEPMRAVGLAVAVADAVGEVKDAAHLILRKEGGRGAVRELAEKILSKRRKR